jgi:hypothetical protein
LGFRYPRGCASLRGKPAAAKTQTTGITGSL